MYERLGFRPAGMLAATRGSVDSGLVSRAAPDTEPR